MRLHERSPIDHLIFHSGQGFSPQDQELRKMRQRKELFSHRIITPRLRKNRSRRNSPELNHPHQPVQNKRRDSLFDPNKILFYAHALCRPGICTLIPQSGHILEIPPPIKGHSSQPIPPTAGHLHPSAHRSKCNPLLKSDIRESHPSNIRFLRSEFGGLGRNCSDR